MATTRKNFSAETRERIENALIATNDLYEAINKGGCGRFAMILGELLEKVGYNVEYVLIVTDTEAANNAQEEVNNLIYGDYSSMWWRHVMVKVNGWLIDSTGFYRRMSEHATPTFQNNYASKPVYKDDMHTFVYGDITSWNCEFDLNLEPKIRRTLTRRLQQIFPELAPEKKSGLKRFRELVGV